MSQVRKLKLPNPVKDSFRVTGLRPQLQRYQPISARLPISYEYATPPRPDQGHLASALAGVAKRGATKTPTMSRKLKREFSRYVDLWLRRNFKPLSEDKLLSFDEWLAGTSYSEARKVELARVWTECGGRPTKRALQVVKCFIKDETYPEYKFPRGIYSRCDAAKCLFGPVVQSVSDVLFSMPWFIKKHPVKDRPMVIYDKLYKPGSKYIYTDYTSFEAHFSASLMGVCENRLYTHAVSRLGQDVRNTVKLMHSVKGGINRMTFKTFSCKQEAGRMSGEMDTSCSNGFTNLMLYLFASFKAGCKESKIVGFVEGDDGLFRNDGPFPTEELFRELGMTIKIGLTDKLERASFCGQVYDIEDKTVVTDIAEQVCRIGWTNKQYVRAKPKVLRELLRAKGYSLAYQFGGCPILGRLGAKILELTEKDTIRQSIIDKMDFWNKEKLLEAFKYGSQITTPGLSTRQLVEELYNITIDEQLEIENKIDNMTNLGYLPFKFSHVPSDWTHYYELYNASDHDEVPVWIPTNERRLIKDLGKSKALDLAQQLKLLRVGT